MRSRSRDAPAKPEPGKAEPAKGRDDPNDRSELMSDAARRVPDAAPREAARPDGLDGFRVEVDAARERVDIILDRPPLNVITMNQRDQLRVAFEAADADSRVRVIVLRASGEHFSSGGEIQGFLDASPEHVSQLAWNIAAPARCKKPVIAASRGFAGVAFELALPATSASSPKIPRAPEQRLGMIPSGGAASPAEDGRHHPRQGHRHALAPHYRLPRVRMGDRHRMRQRCRAGKGDRRTGR
jgi:hypothetical protein